jgi:hypothetical protein
MLSRILRSLLPQSNPFESYYMNLLDHSDARVAPNVREARRDYQEYMRLRNQL